MGVDAVTVRKALREAGINIYSKTDVLVHEHAVEVNMLSLDGVLINCFPSSYHAAHYLLNNGITKSACGAAHHILEVCNGKRKTAYKYKWCFA